MSVHIPTLKAAEAARDEAMRRTYENASEEWKAQALATIIVVADTLGEFTADDLWDAGLEKPVEPRALGPALRLAAREGYIRTSGNYRKSRYRNATPLPVWQDATLPQVAA
ncbi:hypothetical protein SEA_PROVOLONE_64 [Streptomyces phage Provolone]|nr:hypothetical protein SEA_PROVOLONE_64 [Streptomyces phage Provolone]